MLGSKLQWLCAVITCILITRYYHSGEKIDGVIWSDQEGYYIYLQAVFIDGFDGVKCINGCNLVDTENGAMVFTKYTYGVALMESPFFLVAHAVSKQLGYPKDGRSLPYIWAIMLAAIFYMLAGLALISRLLREMEFSKVIQWLVPLGILLGTNLFYYTFRESGMSHVYSFFLFSLLTYSSYRKSTTDGKVWSILNAISLALIILIRPTNAIAGLIPILWGADLKDVPFRIKRFLTDGQWMVTFGIALILFSAPQLLYWKMITGNYLFYSYGDEGFIFWNRPKMLQVLFSPQNGWLVYSPIMMFSIVGLMIMIFRKMTGWLMPTALFLLATYVFGSWWAWWFGGAYGHRCYVDYLPIFAVPMAISVRGVLTKKGLTVGLAALTILAIYVNLRMSDFYHGMWDGPDWGWDDYFIKLKHVFHWLF